MEQESREKLLCLLLFSTTIVIRIRKIVWKHRLNWPFYAFMLRTNLCYNSFFSTVHQNVNKPKSRADRTVYGPIFSPFYVIIIHFLRKYNRIKLCYNRLLFVRETQISTVSNVEQRAKLHRS